MSDHPAEGLREASRDGPVARFALAVSRGIDAFTRITAYLFASLTMILMLMVVHHVVMRYFFRQPTFWAYDLSYMLYGAAFMLGAAVALLHGAHVRTDFLYHRWSQRSQGIVDASLYIFLFFPALYLFLNAGIDYAARSYAQGERGYLSTWRPVIWPLKMVIPISIALLMLQGVSETIKALYAAVKGRWPAHAHAHLHVPTG